MNLEESQILLNVATAMANTVSVGIVSREQAKGILNPLLPKNENIGNNTKREATGTITKQAVSTTSDVK